MAETKAGQLNCGGFGLALQWLIPVIVTVLAAFYALIQQTAPIGPRQSWTDWLRYPVESNALSRLPAFGGSLFGVAIALDGQHAIAVGPQGTVLSSSNAGATWVSLTRESNGFLRSVAITPDGQHIIAVGSEGLLMTSSNAGKTWVNNKNGDVDFYSVVIALDGYHAIAVGDDGTVLTSTNAGGTWARRARVNASLRSVAIAHDSQHAIAVGWNGTVLTSSNAGVTWARHNQGSDNFNSVAIAQDGLNVITVGAGGAVLTSTNAGGHWTSHPQGDYYLNSVAIASDGHHAIAVGFEGTVLTSTNAGRTWVPRTREDQELYSVAIASDDQHAIAVGKNGKVVTSNNVGDTWADQTQGGYALQSVAIGQDSKRAITVGSNGTVLTSGNAGATWARQRLGDDSLQSVAIAFDGEHAIAVGDNGKVLTSSNGGSVWASQTQGSGNYLRSVAIASDGQHAIAVGWNGTVLISANSGGTWTSHTEHNYNLESVAIAPDGEHAIAVDTGGTVLTSTNAGGTWASQTLGEVLFTTVAIAPDGKHAIAAEENGSLLTSANTGQTWRQRGGSVYLRSVAIGPDGQHVVAVGENGKVLTSSDAGETWANQTQGSYALQSVAIAPDGVHAIAVGEYGTVLASLDAGKSWSRLRHPAPHAIYPAPWFYLVLALSALWLWWAFAAPAPREDDSAAAMAASDAPAGSWRQDRLQFTPLARGISRFLRHERTVPPLTLAISGDWGSGKSTLMKLTCEDLKRWDWRTVWFNAWHHQSEEQLLPALLDAIGRQGLPHWLSPYGIVFRLRLLRIRSQAQFVLTLVIGIVAVAASRFLWANRDLDSLAVIVRALNSSGNASFPMISNFLSHAPPGPSVIASWLALVAALWAFLKRLKPFGMKPAKLLAATLANVRLDDISDQTSFRTRFAREFDEVTRALPNPIVIVIDDLDRCQPDAILKIMESVNFLTDSGKCFVIFGMASQRVLASLALSFQDIAKELVEFDLPVGEVGGPATVAENAERERRQRYAQDYLEKLINIEVLVPDRSDLSPVGLLGGTPDEADGFASYGGKKRAKREARVQRIETAFKHGVWPVLLGVVGLAFVSAAWTIASKLHVDTTGPAAASPKPTATPMASPPTTSALMSTSDPTRTAKETQPPAVFVEGENASLSPWWFGGSVLLIASWVGWLLNRRLQFDEVVVRDTQAFKKALRIWAPIAAYERKSPRSIKRFGNRVRYLCMLQQGEHVDWRSRLERVFAMGEAVQVQLQRWRWRGTLTNMLVTEGENNPSNREIVLNEHRVVALGAIQTLFGKDWRTCVEPSQLGRWGSERGKSNIVDAVVAAIEAYQTATGATWPPSNEELNAFARTLKGVRLAGDPLPIGTSVDAKMETVTSMPNANEPAER